MQVFLDADKPSYAKYFDKIINSSPPLLAKGGCIIADNVTWRGQLWAPDGKETLASHLQSFNQNVM